MIGKSVGNLGQLTVECRALAADVDHLREYYRCVDRASACWEAQQLVKAF
jgi:hypothetical protein